MASKGGETGVIIQALAMAMMLCAIPAMAQSDCTSVLISLAPCLNYVTGSSSTPSSSCCSQLASVVQSQPRCLCLVLNGNASSLGVSFNKTLALALPGACNVQTPPVSKCNASDGPPAMSPAGSPESSPSDTSGGSKATTGESTTSNGAVPTMPSAIQFVFFWVFIIVAKRAFNPMAV